MRPIFLGLLGAAAAQYLRVVSHYHFIKAYLESDNGSFFANDKIAEASKDFSFEADKLVVPSGSLGYREDGRVVVGGSEIQIKGYSVDTDNITAIYPISSGYQRFYICYSEDDPNKLYLYYIDKYTYWNNTSSTIEDPIDSETSGLIGTDTNVLTDTEGLTPDVTDTVGEVLIDTNAVEPPSDTDAVEPPSDTDVVAPPSDTDVVAPPSDTDVVAPPSDTDVVAPPSDTDVVAPPSDTDVVAPPIDSDVVEPPVVTPPGEVAGQVPDETTVIDNPLISLAPEVRMVRRVRRVELARRETTAPEPGPFKPVLEGMCFDVQLELVPIKDTDPHCSKSDDPNCPTSCVTECAVPSCLPGLLCPLPECTTRCPPNKCTTICSDVSCADNASCAPSCTTKCDECDTIYATERLTGSWVPKWTVSCPSDVCVNVCTGCSSQGCVPLCTTSCPPGKDDPGISKPGILPGPDILPGPGEPPNCRGTTCKCPTCPTPNDTPKVTVIQGCPTCVHTFTDWVFTCPLVTTITISTCTQNKCSPKTMTFLPGTHTVPGTAVVPVKNNILLTIKPGGTGGGGTGTAKAGASGSSGTTTKPSGSGSGSTTAGNDASRNSLLGTFMGAVLFGLLMW